MAETDQNTASQEKRSRIARFYPAFLVLFTIILGMAFVEIFEGSSLRKTKIFMAYASVFLIAGHWLGNHLKKNFIKTTALVLLGGLTFSIVVLDNRPRLKNLLVNRVHAWNVFHYVLATKYFDEVGYFDLYLAAVLADREDQGVFKNFRQVRDMHTYKDIPMKKALAKAEKLGIRERFTDERWESFKGDMRQILPYQGKGAWKSVLRDLGYNPSPAWLILHRPLLNAVDIQEGKNLQLLCSVQILLFLLTFLICWWGFGIRITLLFTMWFHLFFGNDFRITGGYFSYDWFCLALAAVAVYKKGYPILSAPLLAYAAMMRGFPGLLAVGPAVKWAESAIRLKWPDQKHTRFLFALAACILIIVILGSMTGHGPKGWLEWKEKISLHAEFHELASIRVGMKLLFAHDYSKSDWKNRWKDRRVLLENNKWLIRVVSLLFLIMTIWAIRKRDDIDGMILGMSLTFFFMVLSRYYFSTWVLLFAWSAMDKRRIGNLISDVALFAMIIVFLSLKGIPGIEIRKLYFIFNASLLLYFATIIIFFALKGEGKFLTKIKNRIGKVNKGS